MGGFVGIASRGAKHQPIKAEASISKYLASRPHPFAILTKDEK